MKLNFKPSPNYRTAQTTSGIMRDLTICLLAVAAFSVIYYSVNDGASYGLRVVLLLVDAVAAAMATEAIYFKVRKQDVIKSLKGSYGWVTAIILVLTCRINISYYALFLSTVIAIFFGKLVFGGFGQNIFNPAAFGQAIVMGSFSGSVASDFVTGATPTTAVKAYGWLMSSQTFQTFVQQFGGLGNMFMGNYTSSIGSTSALLILLCAAFLIWRKDIDWRLPVLYLGTIFVTTALIGAMHGAGLWYAAFHLLSGGVMFGAVFMITDPVTTPITLPGRVVFAIGAACLTVIIRIKSNLPDGVLYSILLMNMLVPAIDKLMDGNQIRDAKKLRRSVLIVGGAFAAVTLLTGAAITGKTPAASSSSSSTASKSSSTTAAAGTPVSLNGDFADNKAECTQSSNDGKTAVYACTARGFGLIDPDGIASQTNHEYSRNEAEVTVDLSSMSIKSLKITKFGDTEGVGDAAATDSAVAKYAGASLSSSVDTVSGATYTSKSIASMAQAALKAAGNGGAAQ